MKALVVAAILTCMTAGCVQAQINPDTAERTVYAIKSHYVAAQKVAVQYIRLPRCGSEGALQLCSSPAVVAKIQRADALASSAINTAEAAVRAPEFGENGISQIITSAKAASRMLSDITATLKVQ